MWFKILQIVQFVCSLIAEIEMSFGAGAGAEKKAAVMKTLSAELRKEGLVGASSDKESDAVLVAADHLVEATVEVLNVTGAFSHAPRSEAAPLPDPSTTGNASD